MNRAEPSEAAATNSLLESLESSSSIAQPQPVKQRPLPAADPANCLAETQDLVTQAPNWHVHAEQASSLSMPLSSSAAAPAAEPSTKLPADAAAGPASDITGTVSADNNNPLSVIMRHEGDRDPAGQASMGLSHAQQAINGASDDVEIASQASGDLDKFLLQVRCLSYACPLSNSIMKDIDHARP